MKTDKVSRKTLEALVELDEFILQIFHRHKDDLEGLLNDLKEFFSTLEFEDKVRIVSYISNTLGELILNEISKDFIVFQITEIQEEQDDKTDSSSTLH